MLFGYVKPYKPELKICEFEAYKAVYCGLCGQLGNSFGPLARVTLSYDFTFLSMLHFALSDTSPAPSMRRCYVNPLKKIPCLGEAEALKFGADIAAIMLYYKLLDNISDSGFFARVGWSLLKPAVSSARKKAARARPEADGIIRESIERQAGIESRLSSSLDEAADPTAGAMSRLFELLSTDEKTRRVLNRFGYLLGRFVYICDALDDLEADLKSGGYNPLLLRFEITGNNRVLLDSARDYAKESLYMTIGEAAGAYDLLTVNAYRPVLGNIVELGLRASVDSIISKADKIPSGNNHKMR